MTPSHYTQDQWYQDLLSGGTPYEWTSPDGKFRVTGKRTENNENIDIGTQYGADVRIQKKEGDRWVDWRSGNDEDQIYSLAGITDSDVWDAISGKNTDLVSRAAKQAYDRGDFKLAQHSSSQVIM